MKIYTKKGDKGETSLLGGGRVSKNNVNVNLYGEVDELNSYLGLIGSHIEKLPFIKNVNLIQEVQENLFSLGSKISCPSDKWLKFQLVDVNEKLVHKLEKKIDIMEQELPPLKNFVLPGGSVEASHLHVGRTLTRRVERSFTSFIEQEKGEAKKEFLKYLCMLNRLSDYLFSLSRYVNCKLMVEEILWENKNNTLEK